MTDASRALHLEVPATTASVPVARAAATRWLVGLADATEDDRAALRLTITELVANAVEHGTGPVSVTVTCRLGSVVGVVRDAGRCSEDDRTRDRGPVPVTAERGRGLRLVGAVADEVRVVSTPAGTAAAFVRHLGDPPG